MAGKKYEKAGCLGCKHHQSTLQFAPDGTLLKSMKRKCLKGFDYACQQWWATNGTKKEEDERTVLNCHEYSDFTKRLIDATKETQSILNDLKALNNQDDKN